MEIKDAERLIESFKKRPFRAISVIVVFFLLLSAITYFDGLFGEIGKRTVESSKEGFKIAQSPKDLLDGSKKSEPPSAITQHTEGDQSPVVHVGPGGKSIINYGTLEDRDKTEAQPKLSIKPVNKPYLRYEVIGNNKIAFSYELSISNLGKNDAINISYSHIIQKLVVSDMTVVNVDSLSGSDDQPSKSGYIAPAKVISGDRYFQIFMLNGNNLNSPQINNLIDNYQKDRLAIILDIGIKYTDSITHKEYETTEILKFFKNRDEILNKSL